MTSRWLCLAASTAALLCAGAPQTYAAQKHPHGWDARYYIESRLLRFFVYAGSPSRPYGIYRHLRRLEAIAKTENPPNRAAPTKAYVKSAHYIIDHLPKKYFKVTKQPFTYPYFEETGPAVLRRTAPSPRTYGEADFATMEYSGSGNVTAPVQGVDLQEPPGAVPNSSTSGCEAADFAGFAAGSIALVQRGTCPFADKATNAQAAGASAVIIYNEGQAGRTEVLSGTLGGPGVTIPVVGASYEAGRSLADNGVIANVAVSAKTETRTTLNVIAETRQGRNDRVVVVGAHLDSVPEGPGINDNGTGSGALLEVARAMAMLHVHPRNKVRFAWWGAEEAGLLGSEYYVSQLSEKQLDKIELNLNFDMIGSPNPVRFVYDGDGSDTPTAGPTGSDVIEDVFLNYFDRRGLATDPTAFDGRSDYGPFIAVDIPAGGLFTGAEGIKTPEQAKVYGGEAGKAYDPCYHAACDTLKNVDWKVLEQMSDAVAHATYTFAMNKNSVKDGEGIRLKAAKARKGFDWKGGHLVR